MLSSIDSTASSLIRNARNHEPGAWEHLCALYAPLIYRWLQKPGLNADDMEDIFQEVFVAVWGGIDRFRGDGDGMGFRRWLWGITRNCVAHHFRKRQGLPQAAGGTTAQHDFQQIPDIFLSDEQPEDLSESARVVRRAAEIIRSEFEDRTWQAVMRVLVDQRSTSEVAEEFGMTPSALSSNKSRVLKRLREFLSED